MSQNFISYIDKQNSLSGDFMWNFWKRVGLDLSFNSTARWDAAQQTLYITSLIRGMAPSKIIVANIDSCMENFNEDSPDYKYFQSWKDKGFTYIAIDGNNRTIAINQFLKDEVKLVHGDYLVPNVGTVKVDGTNDTYDRLPAKLREHIDNNVKISLCEYTKAGRVEITQTFINVNSGVALNPQELRNAILVPFAERVRLLAEKYQDAFKHIFKNGNKRRAIDEQIVVLAVYYAYRAEHGVHGISKKDKDLAYLDNSAVWQSFQQEGGEKLIDETLKIIQKNVTPAFKDVSMVLNFFTIICEIHSDKRNILDTKALFDWFIKTENRRWADKTVISETTNGESRSFAACCRATNSNNLSARVKKLLEDLKGIDTGIIADLDPNRLFDYGHRYFAWVKQEGKCPGTGRIIPESEINDHTKWAADHIIPYSKGGKTTAENCQLVDIKWNQKKSAKMPEQLAA